MGAGDRAGYQSESVTVEKTMPGEVHRDEPHQHEYNDASSEEDLESSGEAVVYGFVLRIGNLVARIGPCLYSYCLR